jgi:3-oxoacyl-[acyl-carrier protein] reductase
MQLGGKVAVVTGGSQGIGEAIARAYAREGAKVAILNRDVNKSAVVVASIASTGGEAISIHCDVARIDDVNRATGEVREQFGDIDILVNNAGVYLMSPVGGTDVPTIDRMLDVNIKGVFYLCQAVLPDFGRRGGGKIINIGSFAGNTGFPGSTIYCATKAAVALMTKAMALELRERNIQVNNIAPGCVQTPMNESYRAESEGFLRGVDERFGGPGAWMEPEELVGAAVFLATAGARSITGSTIFVDRGWSAY